MLYESVNFSKTERSHFHEEDQALKSIDMVRGKLEIILQELVAEKESMEQRYQQQKKTLEEQIYSKQEQIERLEQKIRQLQGENQQIRYQHQQRVSMMGILKSQNTLITKEFQREKGQLKMTLEALVRQNRELKDALIQAHFKERRMNKSASREVLYGDYVIEQHFSYEDLDRAQKKTKKYSEKGRDRLLTEGVYDTEPEEQNLSRSSIAAMLRSNPQIHRQSRMTQIKGRGGDFNFQEGLEKMSTKTHLSRQRSPFQ